MANQLVFADQFFAMQRERYEIKLRRNSGELWPWSNDLVFQQWRFTNVFREDDKTTTWFRQNIRQPLAESLKRQPSDLDRLHLVSATLIFRWFNRISTGEIIKDLLLSPWDGVEAYRRLKDVHPVVTGAYMIKTYNGMSKLEGILLAIDNALPKLPKMVPNWGRSLEEAWKDLTEIDFLGGFMAHEIIQDLRYTPILERAVDIMSWGHLGPGAIRGINWVCFGTDEGYHSSSGKSQKEMLMIMTQLLEMSKDPENWPTQWPKWEMHQVEFGLCEFSKYCRAKRGIPQKRRYDRA